MTATLFNRYIWLVETIYSAGHISMEEINRRWANSQYNELREKSFPCEPFTATRRRSKQYSTSKSNVTVESETSTTSPTQRISKRRVCAAG